MPETITALGSLATAALPKTLAPIATGCGRAAAQLYKVTAEGNLQLVSMPARGCDRFGR